MGYITLLFSLLHVNRGASQQWNNICIETIRPLSLYKINIQLLNKLIITVGFFDILVNVVDGLWTMKLSKL